jgi:alpha-glucosidase
LPWSGDASPFGFSPADAAAEPWLRQPAHWTGLTIGRQRREAGSTLNLYRSALRLRRTVAGLGDGPMRWLPSSSAVIAFARGDDFVSMTNLSTGPVALPRDAVVLLASDEIADAHLPPDATAWLRLERPPASHVNPEEELEMTVR